MAYTPENPNGQATMANSSPVVIASNQSAIPVDLNDSTGLALNSLSAGTAQNGLLVSRCATNFVLSSNNSSTTQLASNATFTGTIENIFNQVDVSIIMTADQPITLTINQYIASGGGSIITTWVYNIAANAGFSRSFPMNGNFINMVAKNTGASTTTKFNLNVAYGDIDPVTQLGNNSVAINEIGGTAISAAAKNVQPTTGTYFPTQNGKDSGRTYMTFYIDSITGVTTEALSTMNINTGGTVTTGTSYTVPAGKTLRLQAFSATARSTTANAVFGRIRVRSGSTVSASSGIVFNADIPVYSNAGVTGEGVNISYDIPDGIEFAAAQQIGISQIINTTSSDISVIVTGFLY